MNYDFSLFCFLKEENGFWEHKSARLFCMCLHFPTFSATEASDQFLNQ
jgi:hypothetical protein